MRSSCVIGLPDDDLGNEHLQTLTGTTKLHHVGAQIVRLDNARQRTALAQRGHVAGGMYLGDHARSVTVTPVASGGVFCAGSDDAAGAAR